MSWEVEIYLMSLPLVDNCLLSLRKLRDLVIDTIVEDKIVKCDTEKEFHQFCPGDCSY